METNRQVKCVLIMWITIVILILCNDCSACEDYHSVMNIEALNVKALKHFWKSTGFCPPDPHDNVNLFLLSDDVKINLCIIGALPHRGIEHVRVHWLLDLVKQKGSTLANRQYQYNFTQLDSFLDWLLGHRLNVGFELMGNPGNYFTNFADFAQLQQWETFVSILIQRYMERYSAENVSRWRFEVWNEPDHHDFDQINFTKQTFNNYVKASLKGLRSTATHLQFGGPAENCSPPFNESKFCWSVLQHAEDFDFISIHKKGNEEVDSIWQNELEFYTFLIEKFPPYRQLDLYNDEADVLKNWSLEKEWRADTRYAAFVVSNVLLHVRNLINDRGIPFRSLSHDNGFLNFYPAFFTQRTLLARFQINNTNPRHTQFFKKPVYLAMGLLALLGDKQIHHSIRGHLPSRYPFRAVQN